MSLLNEQIVKLLNEVGVKGEIELTTPPNPGMGDLSFACFGLAKEWKKNPMEVAKELSEKLRKLEIKKLLDKVEVVGPYVNFYLNSRELARLVLESKNPSAQVYPERSRGIQGKIMIEFAHPNTHKPVHIGHLRNMITGESLVRILEKNGHKVVRANYQGDVGMHIAKCLWAILKIKDLRLKIKDLKTIDERAKFLGKMYAEGGVAYEADEKAKKEIEEINAKIYNQDKSIKLLYKKTRKWSLDYFDYIYKRIGIKKFDRLYFESETFELGRKIVLAGVEKGIFKKSEGAVIFEGSKYGLHDRVFINSKGLPTYEAKDQALAKLQFTEYKPNKIMHVVAKEQTEYFKVVFKALEYTLPMSKDREEHLVYGWVSLKEGKMSSRTGQVVLAEWLLDEAEKKIAEVMEKRDIKNKKKVIQDIANAAVKYSMLKTSIHNDIVFDVNEAVSLTGDSGPYLLYIVARINSILRKSKAKSYKLKTISSIEPIEKQLMMHLLKYDDILKKAGEEKDPSKIAKYLFDLAQLFNNFYQKYSVIDAEKVIRLFRLSLISKVKETMEGGLVLLGIKIIEKM